jgi:outer membrane protein assembly factor BamE
MRYLLVMFAFLLASCSSGLPSIKPYRMDIQQGNAITSKMMLQLRPGMTKSQVRFILGTPLIQDSFHVNRWDYFYQMRHNGEIIEQRRVILEFEKEALTRVRGDVVASGKQDALGTVIETTPTAQTEQKKNWIDHLKFWEDDKKPQAIYIEKPLDGTVKSPQQAPADLVNPVMNPAATSLPETANKTLPQPAEVLEPLRVEPAQQPDNVPSKPVLSPTVEPKPAPAAKIAIPVIQKRETTEPAQPITDTSKPTKPAAAKPAIATPAEVTPTNKPAPAAESEKELPPEGAPGYFERLLEKIGF